jgi:hypothetical protein
LTAPVIAWGSAKNIRTPKKTISAASDWRGSMKKTLYVYRELYSGVLILYESKKTYTNGVCIGTTEIEITPVEKPFPKAMKNGETGLIVYFIEPKRGYVLAEDKFHPKNEYRVDWLTDCFTDIKGIQEVV